MGKTQIKNINMTDYKQIKKGPLNQQGTESDKDWEKAAELNWQLNNCPPHKKEEKEKILKKLIGKIGNNTTILTPFYCNLGKTIKIGKNCFINTNCTFLDPETIEIGDNTLIAPGVQIYTANHPSTTKERIIPQNKQQENKTYNYINKNQEFDETIEYTFTNFAQAVKIGKRCWIGGNTIILPGISIGDNTIIGAGSVVTKNIPSNVIAAGTPCKIIKKQD